MPPSEPPMHGRTGHLRQGSHVASGGSSPSMPCGGVGQGRAATSRLGSNPPNCGSPAQAFLWEPVAYRVCKRSDSNTTVLDTGERPCRPVGPCRERRDGGSCPGTWRGGFYGRRPRRTSRRRRPETPIRQVRVEGYKDTLLGLSACQLVHVRRAGLGLGHPGDVVPVLPKRGHRGSGHVLVSKKPRARDLPRWERIDLL